MRKIASGIALAVVAVAVVATPAAAEFFGCNDAKTTVRNYTRASSSYASSRATHEFAAQSSRPRFTFFSQQDRNRYR